jgi:hypothetical protein
MKDQVKFSWLKWGSAVLLVPFFVFGPVGEWMSKASNGDTAGSGLATWGNALPPFVLAMIIFFISIFYWSDGVLKRDWAVWKAHWLKNIGWAILAAIIMFVIIAPVTKYLGGLLDEKVVGASLQPGSMLSFGAVAPSLLAALIPLLAPFYEEIIYHHAITEPFAGHGKVVYVLVSTFSNILFGVTHINNVNGSWGLLIMYIAMGFWFQFVYIRAGRNIWQNIITHFIYNGVISLLSILALLVVWLTGAGLN